MIFGFPLKLYIFRGKLKINIQYLMMGNKYLTSIIISIIFSLIVQKIKL